MSKDIWHKADEAPRYRFQCVYYHRDSKEYYFGEYDATFRVFFGKKTFHQDEVWKFAFAEDVIACLDELERTRKALDVAVDMLKDIDKTRSVANHKIGTQDKTLNSGIVFCWTTPDEIHNALEQIIAEQKD